MIARDVLERMERDFFHYEDDSRNGEKLLRDCVFEEVDLNGDGVPEVIVKLNWLSEGRFNITPGHNYLRGAQDQGEFYVYSKLGGRPAFLGVVAGGAWRTLSSWAGGYREIETHLHMACDKAFLTRYSLAGGRYAESERVLYKYKLNPDGRWEVLEALRAGADNR